VISGSSQSETRARVWKEELRRSPDEDSGAPPSTAGPQATELERE